MNSIFNIKKLQELLQDFYTVTQVRITVFDTNYAEITSYPEALPTFCSIIRSVPAGRNACLACDKAACRKASECRQAAVYQCHAGLMEAAAPIIQGNIVIGYIFFGHLAPCEDPSQGWDTVREHCKDYPVDLDDLKKAYPQRPYFPYEYIRACAQIMNTVASYLCASHIAMLRYDNLSARLEQYIEDHITDNLSIDTLCEVLNISRCALYKISDETFGLSPSEYVKRIRMQKAATLLTTSSSPISEVAAQVGIADYNYFSKVFKAYFGQTPRDYRCDDVGAANRCGNIRS